MIHSENNTASAKDGEESDVDYLTYTYFAEKNVKPDAKFGVEIFKSMKEEILRNLINT